MHLSYSIIGVWRLPETDLFRNLLGLELFVVTLIIVTLTIVALIIVALKVVSGFREHQNANC